MHKNKKILITLGATIEDIDPVRYITNRSSGKQGFAIAEAIKKNGYEPVIIKAKTDIKIPITLSKNIIEVRSAKDMLESVEKNIKDCEIAIFAAAVSDWTPMEYMYQK